MKKQTVMVASAIMCLGNLLRAQKVPSEEYVEFNDRKNVVHGVYLGIQTALGKVEDDTAYFGGLKLAYVANSQFEIGLTATFMFTEQPLYVSSTSNNDDLIGVYGGLHLEPIFFSKSRVNVSVPLTIGMGTFGFVENYYREQGVGQHRGQDDFDEAFIMEPGINLLFNVSRYLQMEAGIRYRFASEIDLRNGPVSAVDGISVGLGVKIGVFNLGRNRYRNNI